MLNLFGKVDPKEYDLHLLCLLNPSGPQPIFDHAFWAQQAASRHTLHIHEMPGAISASDVRALKTIVRDCNIQALSTHDARSNVMGLSTAKRLGLPSMAFAHGWVNWTRPFSKARLYAELEAFSIRMADLVMVASLAMKQDLRRRGIREDKIRHVPHGVDTERFRPGGETGSLRDDLGIPGNALLIGNVARIQPCKGHKLFLEAAADIHRVEPNIHFVVVGDITVDEDTVYRDELLQYRSALGLDDCFHFSGTRTDIPEVMRSLDLFVLSSLREPFGWVLLESQACGVPVVSFAVDGTPEALADGVTGLLVPAEDAGALAERCLEMMASPEKRNEMGAAGRERVEQQFSLAAMAQGTKAVYRELLTMKKT